MKKLILLMMALVVGIQVHAQETAQSFKIKGKFFGKEIEKTLSLTLNPIDGSDLIKLESKTINGEFEFTGKAKLPLRAEIIAKDSHISQNSSINNFLSMDSKIFYLDSTEINIFSKNLIKESSVYGSLIQDQFAELQIPIKPLERKMIPITERVKELTKNGLDSITMKKMEIEAAPLKQIRQEINDIEDDFIFNNPSSYLSLDMIAQKTVVITNPEKFKKYYKSLSKELLVTSAGKYLTSRYEAEFNNAIGSKISSIKLPNSKGKLIAIDDFKGKYLLIDFWASWCGPCRLENPNLVKAYKNYKSKNFEILGISLDKDKKNWLDAMKKDNLIWTNLIDVDSKASNHFGIKAIPQNILVDPNGIIIAKNIYAENLTEFLNKELNK